MQGSFCDKIFGRKSGIQGLEVDYGTKSLLQASSSGGSFSGTQVSSLAADSTSALGGLDMIHFHGAGHA